jgi:hypothetical protein
MDDPVASFRQTWNNCAAFPFKPALAKAVYLYDSAHPKACFHPLVTPKGHVLSGWMSSDHVWHRGLWFTIKLINDANFWEEEALYGIQQSLSEPKVELLSEDSAQITHALEWTAQATGVVFKEKRILTMTSDADGITYLTWNTTLHATQALILDRTPFTTWGGYSGMSIRTNREVHEVRFRVPGDQTCEALTGQTHDWVVLEGRMDGGPDERVSMGIIDHPDNPRSPSPWYGKSNNGFTFLNAAFLFHDPLHVGHGEELHFRYRIAYRDGTWQPGEFERIAGQFRQS